MVRVVIAAMTMMMTAMTIAMIGIMTIAAGGTTAIIAITNITKIYVSGIGIVN